jgi:hypothetical protein
VTFSVSNGVPGGTLAVALHVCALRNGTRRQRRDEAAPGNIALFNNTTAAPINQGTSPVLPERSHYFDAGIDQNIPSGYSKPAAKDCTDLELGVDVYYKLATDLIDNGIFGQAPVLSAFNYAKGINEGIEFTAKFHSGNFQAYGNLAVAQQKAPPAAWRC